MSARQWVCCAVMVAFACLPVTIASAEDLFGGLGQDPAAVQAAVVDPAAGTAESPAGEIASLTAGLPAEGAAGGKDFCRCVGESDSAAVARIEKALSGPLRSTGLHFSETPLEEVVNLLQEEYGIPIQLDETSLEEVGLAPSEKVTISLNNISLRSALRLMLQKLQLTYIIQDEVLLITTPEEAESALLTCVYNVRGFMDDTSAKSMDALIDTIVSCVSTETWAENGGGEAEIRVPGPGLLVISQTQAVHEEINGLLSAIREMRDARPVAGDAGAAAATTDQVVTRSYVLQIKQPSDAEKLRNQVREMIVQSLPDEQWEGRLDDGQPVLLAVLSDRVVVLHKPAVQEKVQAALTDSGVAVPATSGEARRRRQATGGGGRSAKGGEMGGGGGGGGGFF